MSIYQWHYVNTYYAGRAATFRYSTDNHNRVSQSKFFCWGHTA